MNVVSDISSNAKGFWQVLTTPSSWDRQTVLLVAGVCLFLAAIVFAWLSVGSVETVRSQSVNAYRLSVAPALSDTQDAASAKNKTMTSAILLTLGFLCFMAGAPFAAGVFVGSAY
jgi:hypothetical protein